MSDGKWNGAQTSEILRQDLTRHRLLSVYLGNTAPALVGPDPTILVSSYFACLSPNNPGFGPTQPGYLYGGPHFVMSNETPDQAHTFGVQLALLNGAINLGVAAGDLATPLAGNFTLTLWCLISTTEFSNGQGIPIWASLNPVAGVQFNELYHSFDINATAIRVQIENGTSANNGVNSGVIAIAMSEL